MCLAEGADASSGVAVCVTACKESSQGGVKVGKKCKAMEEQVDVLHLRMY